MGQITKEGRVTIALDHYLEITKTDEERISSYRSVIQSKQAKIKELEKELEFDIKEIIKNYETEQTLMRNRHNVTVRSLYISLVCVAVFYMITVALLVNAK